MCMDLKNIYLFVEKEIRNEFKTKSEMGRVCGKTRQEINGVLNKLKNNSGITYKKVEEFLNFLDYELVIKKRG